MNDTPTPVDNLFSFLDDDGLPLLGIKSTKYPNGHDYMVPSPDAETGMRISALGEIMAKKSAAGAGESPEITSRDVERLQLNDDEERDLQQQVLGPVLDQLIADGVSHVRIKRLMLYVFFAFAYSPEQANEAARKGAFAGKELAPTNRAARRASTKSKKKTSSTR